MNARRNQPPDTTALTQQLDARFHLPKDPEPREPAPAPAATPPAPQRPRPEPERVRRTYYFSREVAGALEAAAARIHYGSHGTVPKHQAYDELIRAGLDHADEIQARHQQ